MATYRCWSGSGATFRVNSTAYSLGARMQPATADGSSNVGIARRYVWECTTAGTSGAAVPTWSASYTPDSSTITDGTVTWTCRNPGYSSGSTVDWTFAALVSHWAAGLLADADDLLIQYTHSDYSSTSTLGLQPTANNCRIISVDKDASEDYTPMDTSGSLLNTSANAICEPATGKKLSILGLTLACSSTSTFHLFLNRSDDAQLVGKDIRLTLSGNNATPYIQMGGIGDCRSSVNIQNLTIARAHASQVCRLSGVGEIQGCTLAGAGAVTTLFTTTNTVDSSGTRWLIHSLDATAASSSGTLVADGGVINGSVEFHDPILPSSYAILSGAGNLNKSGLEVLIVNGKAGATTGIHAYANALGSVTRNTTITYNGESFSWKIDASASATRACPFVLPWMWGQIATGASVTPKIEILRDGSATALTDAQVWCERGAQVTSGSPLKTFVSTEAAYTSSGSNIAAGAGLGSWAGETTTGAPDAWSGKLAPAACTPEGDELMMRICVATTTTIYAAQGWDT